MGVRRRRAISKPMTTLCGAIKQFLEDYQGARGTTKVRLHNVRPYTFPSFMDYRMGTKKY